MTLFLRSITTYLPLRIESVANLREHWAKTAKRTKLHRQAALGVMLVEPLPVIVELMRIAPRPLDDDNLRSAFKALRDGIADRYGVKDNDPRIEWRYSQHKGPPKSYGATVTISSPGGGL